MEKIKTWLHKAKQDAEDGIQPWTSVGPHWTTTAVTPETPSPSSSSSSSSQRETRPAGPPRHFDPDNRQSVTSSARLPARPLLSLRSDGSLPSSPRPGLRRRPACSLPCSPLLGGASRSSAPCPPAAVSRLWVEAALQRSKNTRQVERPARPPAPLSQRGGRDEEEWSDEEEEEEEEGAELLCVDADRWRYCLLTPCVCLRCPSAPPLEDQYLAAESSHSAPSLGAQVDVHGSHRDGAPRPPQLYPSLSAWRSTDDAQDQRSRRHQEGVDISLKHNTLHSCFQGNSGSDPCVRTPGGSGWDVVLGCPQSSSVCLPALSASGDQSGCLQVAPEFTSCCLSKARPPESCSFCSDDFSVKLSPREGGSCGSQVFCCRCLSRFVSFLQVARISQPAGL